ncbi:hypothetical protein ACQQ2N_20135 [Dokdonella sp. MW10]|uniref:hypothetical protein n=1 Tax=Dokdonella sp. MW10 TaxID=2992926 RepID=UPI003F80D6B3
MRSTVQVQRRWDSFGPAQIGDKAKRVLELVRYISDIRVERQYVDQALLSFEDSDDFDTFAELDELLAERGLERV